MAKRPADDREGNLPDPTDVTPEERAALEEEGVLEEGEAGSEESGETSEHEHEHEHEQGEEAQIPEVEEIDDNSPHFHLSFVEGKAYVGFQRRQIGPWIEARDLALEVPDITFPFDVTGGADRFRNRRCRLVRLSFFADREGLEAEIMRRLDPERSGLADLEIAVGDGFVELAGTAPAGDVDVTGNAPSTPGERVPFTLKLAVDASTDWAVRIMVHDVRLYAPSALAAPAVGVSLLEAFDPGGLPLQLQAPALAILRPVPAYIRGLMPRHGWKLPDMRGITLSQVSTERTRVGLIFDAAAETHTGGDAAKAAGMRSFLSSIEGAREYGEAEGALAAGHTAAARDLYLELAGPLPDHPFAAERLMTLLAADPAHRDAARDLADAWLEREPRSAMALWTRAVTLAEEQPSKAARAFLRLSEMADEQGERLGTIYAAAAAGELAARAADRQRTPAEDDPDAARQLSIEAFERVLRHSPSHRVALDQLSSLYRDAADPAAAIHCLERLVGLTPDPGHRSLIHLSLARLHAGAILPVEGAAAFSESIARAKLHFDAALRDDPELIEAWLGLGRACAVEDDALRAVRCLDEGKQRLVDRRRLSEAAAVAFEIGELWDTALDHPDNALLRYAQAVELEPSDVEARRRHAELCLRTGRQSEAETALRELLSHLDVTSGDPTVAVTARETHLSLAKIAREVHEDLPATRRHLQLAWKLCELAPDAQTQLQIAREEIEVCELLGEESALAAALERLAEVQPGPEAAALLARAARVRLGDGELEAARELLTRAREMNPATVAIYEVLAETEATAGDPVAQAAALEILLEHQDDPDDRARSHLELAGLYGQLPGRADEALRALEAVHETTTELAVQVLASRQLVSLARDRDEPPALADALMRLAEDLSAGDEDAVIEAVECRQEEARIRFELGDGAAAIAVLRTARSLRPRAPRLLWQLGETYLAVGDAEAAHLTFLDFVAAGGVDALGLEPTRISRTMGEAALEAGEDAAAATHLLSAHRARPEDLELALQVAGLLATVERPMEEAEVLRRIAAHQAEAGEITDAVESWIGAAQCEHEAGAEPARIAGAFAQALDLALDEEAVAWSLEQWSQSSERPTPPENLAELWAAADGLYGLARQLEVPALVIRALGVLAALSETRREASGYLERVADLHLSDGDTDAATEWLGIGARLAPERQELRERYAEALAPRDRERALAQYELLFDRDAREGAGPPDLETERRWRHRAGELALEIGLEDRAAHHLGIYLAHNPADEETLARQVKLLDRLEAWPDLYALRVHQAEVLVSRISREEGEGAREGAREAYHAAARLALEKLDRPDLARESLETCLELKPDATETLRALLELLDPEDDVGRIAELHGALVDSVEDPDERAAQSAVWAEALLRAGDPAAAVDAYRGALEIAGDRPEYTEGLANAAWVGADVATFLEAADLRAHQAVAAGAPDAASRLLAVARVHEDAGRRLDLLELCLSADLAATLEEAERLEAHRSRLPLARALEAWGAVETDLGALIAAAGRRPPSERAALLIERAALREGPLEDLDGAREDYASADHLDPSSPTAFESLLALCRRKDDDAGIASLLTEKARRLEAAGESEAGATLLLDASALYLGPLADAERAAQLAHQVRDRSMDETLRRRAFQIEEQGLRGSGKLTEALKIALEATGLLDTEAAELRRLELATEADAEGEAILALKALRAARREAPESLPVAAALLERLFLLGALEEAAGSARVLAALSLAELPEALDLDTHEAFELHRLCARVLVEAGDAAAGPLMEAMFEQRPGDEALADALAASRRAAGDLEGVERVLAAHRETLRPQLQAHAARRLADLAAERGDHDAEVRWLEAAGFEGSADFDRALRVRLSADDLPGAIGVGEALIQKYLEEDNPPAASLALVRLAETLLERDEAGESLALLGRFPELREFDDQSLFAWVRAAEATEDLAGQIDAHETRARYLLESEGDAEASAEALAVVAALQEGPAEDPAAALATWLAALEIGEDEPRTERALHALELARGLDDAEAMADLHERLVRWSRVEEDAVAEVEHLLSLARLHRDRLEAPEQARAAFEAVLALREDQAEARESLLELLEAAEDHAALARLQRLRARDERDAAVAARIWLAVADAHRALSEDEAEREALEKVEALDAAALHAGGQVARLDALLADAGEDRRRAERRVATAEATDDEAEREGLYLEAAGLYRDTVHDDAAARDALQQAFEVRGSQGPAQALRDLLAKHEDHRGLALLAERQAEDVSGPARAGLLRSAGDLYRDEVGDDTAAIAAYRAALEEQPRDAVILERIEGVLRERGVPAPLADFLRERVEQSEGETRSALLQEIATLEREAGDQAAELETLLQAEADAPQDLTVVTRLAAALEAAGRRPESIERHHRLFEADPADREQMAHLHTYYLSRPLEEQRPLADILVAHGATLEDEGERDGLEREALEVLATVGDREALVELVRELRERHPQDDELLEILVDTAREEEDLPTLRGLLEEGALLTEGRAEVGYRAELARVCQALEDYPAALDAYAAALDIEPDRPGALVEAIHLAEQLGDESCRPFDGRLLEAVDRGQAVAPSIEARVRLRLRDRALRGGDEAGALDHLRAAEELKLEPATRQSVIDAISELSREARSATVQADAHALLASLASGDERLALLEAQAEARESSGETAAALAAWQELFELDPLRPRPFEVLRDRAREGKDLETLTALHHRRLALHEEEAEQEAELIALAEDCESIGGASEPAAVAAWRELFERDPAGEQAFEHLADRAEAEGDIASLRAVFYRHLETFDSVEKKITLLQHLAEICETNGEAGADEAKKAWQELFELDASSVPAFEALTGAAETSGDFETLGALYHRRLETVEGDDEKAALLEALAERCEQAGEVGGEPAAKLALQTWQERFELDPLAAAPFEALSGRAKWSEDFEALRALHHRRLERLEDEGEQREELLRLAEACEAGEEAGAAMAAATWQELFDRDPRDDRAFEALVGRSKQARDFETLRDLHQRRLEVMEDENEKAGLLVALAALTEAAGEAGEAAASATWRELLERDPENQQAFEALVARASEARDFEALTALYYRRLKVLEGDGPKAELLLELAELCEAAGDATGAGPAALAAWRELFDLDPSSARAFEVLSDQAETSGDLPSVRAVYHRHLEAVTDDERKGELLLGLAEFSEAQGEAGAAADALLAAWQLEPGDHDRCERALPVLRARRRQEGGAQDLDRALSILATGARNRQRLAYYLEAMEALLEAHQDDLAAVRASLAIDLAESESIWDEEVEQRVRLMVDLLHKQTEDPAEQARLAALEARAAPLEQRGEVLHRAAEAWKAAGNLDAAFGALEDAASIAPEDPGSRLALARMHLETGDIPAAAGKLAEIAALGGTIDAAAAPLLGELEEAGEHEKAAGLYDHLIAASPHDRDLAGRAADAWERAGGVDRASELIEWLFATGAAAGESEGEQAAHALRLASLRADSGDPVAAAEAWERALAVDPTGEVAFEGLRDYYGSRKDPEALTRIHRLRADGLDAAGLEAEADALRLQAAHAAVEAGEPERGRSILEGILARTPGHPEANKALADMARAAGDVDAERDALSSRLNAAEDPEARAVVALSLGQLESRVGDMAAATSAFRIAYATAISSADPAAGPEARPEWANRTLKEAAPELARGAMAADQAEAALTFIDVARGAGVETDSELALIEGRAALHAGHHDRSRDAFEQAFGDPLSEQMAVEGLVQLAVVEGDLRGEINLRERLAEMGSESVMRASVWLELAERAHAAGEEELAATAEQRALELEPGSHRAFERKRAALADAEDLEGMAELLRSRARHAENVDDRARAFLELGLLYRDKLQRMDEAVDAFERAVGIDPELPLARACLAEALFAQGKRSESREHYEAIALGTPDLPAFVIQLRLAEIAETEERPTEALALFRTAAEHNAAFLPAWEGVVRIADRLEDMDRKAWGLEGLLGALPMEEAAGRFKAMKELGAIERHQLHNERAISLLEQALELQPGDLESLFELAQVYEAQGRWAELRDTLQQLSKAGLAPDEEAAVLVRLATVLTDRFADADGALPILERATRADASHSEAWVRLLELVAPRGEAATLARVAKHLLELGRVQVLEPFRLEAGRALLATGNGAWAADLLVAAARERPEDRQLVAEAASAASLAGKHFIAKDLMVQLAETTGDAGDLRAAADAALMAGESREYVELLWRGLEDEGMDPEIRALAARGLSWVMADQVGDPSAAADGLLPIAAERPEDRALQRDLATLLDSAGRAEEAMDLWQSIALRDPTDQLALGRLARLLEAAASTRSAFVRGLAAFLEGDTPRDDGVALAGVEVSYLTRNDLSVAEAGTPVAWFFRAMAPVLEPLFPTDLSPYGIDPGKPLDPATSALAARATELASVLTDREFQIFRSEVLGFEYRLENTRPVSIIVGRPVAEASIGAQDQVLIRALDLVGAGYALPSKFAADDLSILVRLAASFFDPVVSVQIPPDKLGQYHQAMRVLCPDEQKWKLMPLAKEAISAIDYFEPRRFGPALHRTSDRVALLVTGDVSGALATRLKLDGHETEGEGVRELAVLDNADLRDLALFLLRSDIDRLWEEVQRR